MPASSGTPISAMRQEFNSPNAKFVLGTLGEAMGQAMVELLKGAK